MEYLAAIRMEIQPLLTYGSRGQNKRPKRRIEASTNRVLSVGSLPLFSLALDEANGIMRSHRHRYVRCLLVINRLVERLSSVDSIRNRTEIQGRTHTTQYTCPSFDTADERHFFTYDRIVLVKHCLKAPILAIPKNILPVVVILAAIYKLKDRSRFCLIETLEEPPRDLRPCQFRITISPPTRDANSR